MADEMRLEEYLAGRSVPELSVRLEHALQAGTLRYFSRAGAFASAVRDATGLALPDTQQAAATADGQLILAWRRPTETLCLTPDAARLGQLAARLADSADGCFVNLTGSLKAVCVSGERTTDLLCRLGGTASVPQAGETRRSRLADVPVVALRVKEAETLLLVDRGYAPHLLGWIRETLADWT